MKSKLLRGVAAACIAASLFTLPASAATIGGGTVKADALNLRSEASTSSTSKQLISQNAYVIVESESNGWSKIIYEGTEGYVKSEYISLSDTLDGNVSAKAYISGTNVRMRSEASTSGAILGEYNTGAEVKILGVSGNWYKVTIGSQTGYVCSDYVSFAKSESSSAASANQSIGAQIAAFAQNYVGYNYSWGGKSPSTGFDCSGLCYYCYGQYGYSLHRVAQDMYTYDGTWVSKDNLQPGDLVFFGSSSYISHVGMYIGNGKYVHASTYSTGVIISDLSSRSNYQGAKRIV